MQVRGFRGNVGEFGHVAVDRHGDLCPECGQRGRLEMIASMGAVVTSACRAGMVFVGDSLV